MTSTATSPVLAAAEPRAQPPTIWGCTPRQTHDRFWAAFGVQVVRRREPSEIVAGADLFLLCEPGTLVLFRPSQVLDTLYWLAPRVLVLRACDTRPRAYRELAVTQDEHLVRFERHYRDTWTRSSRVALTPDRDLARLWQDAPGARPPWRWLRTQAGRDRSLARRADVRLYDEQDGAQVMECLRDLMRCWRRPDTTIRRARRVRPELLADPTADVAGTAVFHGPVWVGAGRRVEPGTHVVGPAVLWDDPAKRPSPEEVRWPEIDPAPLGAGAARRVRPRAVPGKRAFDVVFAACALVLTAPLFPLVALAILLEDGRPVFFAHRRETVGGREFPCLKFRSMRKGADAIKAQLVRANQADGPQFFIPDDPRVTRVGRLLRKLHVDEIPQFLNVLAGHMSIVGPRPSPYRENQYCPAWREARLSVRPGITGLWQVMRTRRRGLDFQEWIRFDLEYVQRASWLMDLTIVARTVGLLLHAGGEGRSPRAPASADLRPEGST
jgi:lipopolysaccharide/colanic/teichoic acid biosynthesis glycosyltransferase